MTRNDSAHVVSSLCMSATFLVDRYEQSPFADACQFSIMQLPAKHENKKVKLTYERKKRRWGETGSIHSTESRGECLACSSKWKPIVYSTH